MKKQTPKRLLCYMDFGTHTGFNTVSTNLMKRLLPFFGKNNYEVLIVATNYHGPNFSFGKKPYTATVISARSVANDPNDLWCRDGALKLLNEFPIDIFWAINDIPVLTPIIPVIEKIKTEFKVGKKHPDFKTVFYCPVDSYPNPSWSKGLDKVDKLVTYTKYGKVSLQGVGEKTGQKLEPIVIPHGVDKDSFGPIPNFQKKKIRKRYGIPEDAFVFGNINKNNARKNIGGTLLAFRDFRFYAEKLLEPLGCPKPHLYLHMSPTDPTGINLYRACEVLGIQDYVSFPNGEDYVKGKGYSVGQMNEIYNCLDCYVTTSTAEGWGLGVTEAMSVNLPIVAPMHTSLQEITAEGDAVYAVWGTQEHFQVGMDYENVRFVPDVFDVKAQMCQVYEDVTQNRDEVSERTRAAYKPLLEKYDWNVIAEQWKTVFSDIL